MTPKRTLLRYTAEFKTEVALAALTERQPLADLAAYYQLTVAKITRGRLHLRQQAAQVFAETPVPGAAVADVEPMYAAISRLQMENTLLKNRWGHVGNPTRHSGRPARPRHFGAGPLPGPEAFTQ